MTLEQELDRAIEVASEGSAEDERVAAVMPASPEGGATLFLVAFEREPARTYVVLDGAGGIVTDRRRIGDVVTIIALAELAEELSAATSAEHIERAFTDVAERLRQADPQSATAATAVAAAAAAVGSAAAGPRAASPAYLDSVARAAGALGAEVDTFEQHAQRLAEAAASDPAAAEPAAVAWQALALAARSGDPAGLAHAMTASSGSVEALLDEVLEHYRVPLS